MIDLLERQPLHLGHEEVRKSDTDAAQAAPEEEHFSAEVGIPFACADEIGRDDADDAVPEPIRRGGETDTSSANGERENFADDDPGCGAPGHAEHGDVDTDEGNHS